MCRRYAEKEDSAMLLQMTLFGLWRLWKCRTRLHLTGQCHNPGEVVQLLLHHVNEFSAAKNTRKVPSATRSMQMGVV